MVVVVGGGTGAGTDLEATDVLHPTPAFVVLVKTLRDGLHSVAVQHTHTHTHTHTYTHTHKGRKLMQ